MSEGVANPGHVPAIDTALCLLSYMWLTDSLMGVELSVALLRWSGMVT
jgi:hypothetical protein